MVGFWSLFWKNFPQPKFYTRSTAIPRFVYRESTHLSVSSFFVYHSQGKTGQVIFLNACKITTVIQTTDNNCEGTRSDRTANACVT